MTIGSWIFFLVVLAAIFGPIALAEEYQGDNKLVLALIYLGLGLSALVLMFMQS